ncbi:MAG: hypothetical protein HY679_01250 [Chloroflexi bacterium]|nr:hypothetical protein [Chloroflexota bacterium]
MDNRTHLEFPMPHKASAQPSLSLPKAQKLHWQGRKRIEKFLCEIANESAEHVRASRDPLEQPWSLTEKEFMRRVKTLKVSETFRVYERARDETAALTDTIGKVERELDGRVQALYGL